MIKIKGSAVTILTGPLDAVRDFHAVAKHTGDREQALPPASQWPNAADLLWNLSCSAPFQPTAETPLYSVQSAPGRFPFRHCSQPVTSAHVGGTVPDAFTSAFQAPCQSTKHLILFFFFYSLHRSNYNAKRFAEWGKVRGCMESVCHVLVGIFLFPVPNNGEKSTR